MHTRHGVDGWEILDGHGASIGCFDSRRDADFVCGCVNGDRGPQKATQVRWVAKDLWVGVCNICQPVKFFLDSTWPAVFRQLREHHNDEHEE